MADANRTQSLTYQDVLEYLADRSGDLAVVHSYPTFPGGGGSTMLGLQVTAEIGSIEPVDLHLAEFVQGQAAVRISLDTPDGMEDGLVLTREWFRGATLENRNGYLRVIVAADTGAQPLYPPIGEEGDPDEARDVALHELVGWGFAFDFDGEPPFAGRWAERSED